MDKSRLFQFLSTQDAAFLLDLLSTVYDEMDHDQRRWMFGDPACPKDVSVVHFFHAGGSRDECPERR